MIFITTFLCGCKTVPMQKVDMVILHLGSGATPKIAEKLKNMRVSYVILEGLVPTEEIKSYHPKGVIITGSPESLLDEGAPRAPASYYKLDIPILGLCYGMQMIAEQLGGKVKKCTQSEKGMFPVTFTGKCGLTPEGMKELHVLMDHDDCVVEIPKGFHTDASSSITQHAMICSHDRKMYLIQFHPERYDTAPASCVILDAFINKVTKRK
jgi:GMP synthase (glutamine-hydrolysing)